MRIMFVACLVLCASCGSALLQPGTYSANITYTRDDWSISMAGQTTHAVWNIAEDAGKYKLDIVSGSQDLPGKEDGNRVVFEMDQIQVISGCENGQTFLLELDPNSDGDAFTGYGKVTVSYGTWGGNIVGCDGIVWVITEVTVSGKQD